MGWRDMLPGNTEDSKENIDKKTTRVKDFVRPISILIVGILIGGAIIHFQPNIINDILSGNNLINTCRIDLSNKPTLSRNKVAGNTVPAPAVDLQPVEKAVPVEIPPGNDGE